MPDAKDQVPVEEDEVVSEETNVNAQAEDEQVATKSEVNQLKSEAADLDESNIIDDSPGVTTRGAKVDATKQEREIDAAVDAAAKADEQS
ncbi:uncharacterized protein PFL1_04350 [Pseudozyma flocculosa PF-1]|uniref:Uncharacterized protein n=2 Tax=Pseudozyma flocculosa TaxID=84751 RepID=A0A5C3FAW7_9BASI|nr:uncharacterized protein PFL1_04350 [Pseudozyma flocculosa PF-1]EPQ28023.1 hypothetical protein PFL1_04350 [Pseudozyma flocculosa PF-1]SPO41583.1 uncharacterized protein PSFLO_07065 [Pseudozyma flocculosa]